MAPEVIAVNQVSLGVTSDLIWKQGPLEVGNKIDTMGFVADLTTGSDICSPLRSPLLSSTLWELLVI